MLSRKPAVARDDPEKHYACPLLEIGLRPDIVSAKVFEDLL